MPKKAIIFDCDGTLVDSEMLHFNAWSHALKKQGYDFTLEEYYSCVGIPSEKNSQILAKKIGKDCAEELKNDKIAFFGSKILHGVSPIEHTLKFLQELAKEQKRYQYKLAIASGAARGEIMLYLKHLKIEHLFDLVLSGKDDLNHYSDPEGINKPKPYIYLEAAFRLGVHPQECVAIEDSHIGVMASATAGCYTVAVPTPFSIQHDFSAADLVVSSFDPYSVDQFLKEVG